MFTRVSPNRIATRSFPFFHSFLFYFSFVFISSLFLPPASSLTIAQQQTNPYFFLFLERRWSSRTFRYGYLVTTSPQLSDLPSAAPSKGWVTDFGHSRLPWCDGRCVQDPGTYSPQHSDLRLLAIPASCSRVADYNPNWDVIFEICLHSRDRFPLFTPL